MNIGEWWVTETGDLIPADGEGYNPNHELAAWLFGAELFLDALVDKDDEVANRIYQHLRPIVEADIHDPIMFREELNNIWDELFQDGLVNDDNPIDYIVREFGIDDKLVDLLFDIHNDDRLYAIQEFGWIRIAESNIEFKSLTMDVVERIADAILELESMYNFNLKHVTFTLESREPHIMFYDVPYSVVVSGKIGGYKPYRASVV